MLSATVAQKPTMPVSDGIKKRRNSAVVGNLLGARSTGPSPPALPVIHHKSRRPMPSMNGAPMPSRNLMVSMPRQMTAMLSPQKAKKQIHAQPGELAAAGQRILSREKMACPPIQVWMPNHPQATSARSTAGMLAPRTPKEARTNTAKGMPYLAPACALSSMGMSTIRLLSRIVPMACHQLRSEEHTSEL